MFWFEHLPFLRTPPVVLATNQSASSSPEHQRKQQNVWEVIAYQKAYVKVKVREKFYVRTVHTDDPATG
jgi:hypothetical protein